MPVALYPVNVCVTITGGAGAVSPAKTFCSIASEKISPKTEAFSLNMAFPLPTGNKWALRKEMSEMWIIDRAFDLGWGLRLVHL